MVLNSTQFFWKLEQLLKKNLDSHKNKMMNPQNVLKSLDQR